MLPVHVLGMSHKNQIIPASGGGRRIIFNIPPRIVGNVRCRVMKRNPLRKIIAVPDHIAGLVFHQNRPGVSLLQNFLPLFRERICTALGFGQFVSKLFCGVPATGIGFRPGNDENKQRNIQYHQADERQQQDFNKPPDKFECTFHRLSLQHQLIPQPFDRNQ